MEAAPVWRHWPPVSEANMVVVWLWDPIPAEGGEEKEKGKRDARQMDVHGRGRGRRRLA